MKNAYTHLMSLETLDQQVDFFKACIELMDDELREQVCNESDHHNESTFLKSYCDLHRAKFNEDFCCE